MATTDNLEGRAYVDAISIRLAFVALALSVIALEDMVFAAPGDDAFITSHEVQGVVIWLAVAIHAGAFAWYWVAGRERSET